MSILLCAKEDVCVRIEEEACAPREGSCAQDILFAPDHVEASSVLEHREC